MVDSPPLGAGEDIFSKFAFHGDGATLQLQSEARELPLPTNTTKHVQHGEVSPHAAALESEASFQEMNELGQDEDSTTMQPSTTLQTDTTRTAGTPVKVSGESRGSAEAARRESLRPEDLSPGQDLFTRFVYGGCDPKLLESAEPSRQECSDTSSNVKAECGSPSAVHEPPSQALVTPEKAFPLEHTPEDTPQKAIDVAACADLNALQQFAFQSGQPQEETSTPACSGQGETNVALAVRPGHPKPLAPKQVSAICKLVGSDHPTFKEAEELGLGSAFRNLTARDDIRNSGLPFERLLELLQEAGGLVNKAKAAVEVEVAGQEQIERVGQPTKQPSAKRRRIASKRSSKTPRLMEPDHPTVKVADELGLGSAFRNLATRDDIVNSGLPMDRLLDALREANGLVNKAKAALLGV